VDLNVMLQEHNTNACLRASVFDALGASNRLPLQYFDNTEYDCHPIERWIQSVSPGSVGARAAFFQPDAEPTWEKCQVSAYDASIDMFSVVYASTLQEAKLPRVFICFDAENPADYVARLLAAIERRQDVHLRLLLSLYVDNMPLDKVKALDSEQTHRIFTKALNINSLRDKSIDTSSVLEQYNTSHVRTLNRIALEKFLEEKESDELLRSLRLGRLPVKDAVFPVFREVEIDRNVAHSERIEQFAFQSLLTRPEIIHILLQVQKDTCSIESVRANSAALSAAETICAAAAFLFGDPQGCQARRIRSQSASKDQKLGHANQ
jgi:dynein heavy chain